MSKWNLKNGANTEVYQKLHAQIHALFCPECLCTEYYQNEYKVQPLPRGYVLHTDRYANTENYSKREILGILSKPTRYCIHEGKDCRLMDSNEEIIMQWRSASRKAQVYHFEHSNCKLYLICFHDFSGWTVLDVEAREMMQYLPMDCIKTVLDAETKERDLGFQCLGFIYNPINNLMAIDVGHGTHIFDFTDPIRVSPDRYKAWMWDGST